MSNLRLERALAELVAGDGGWSLWLGALAELERALKAGRKGEQRFNHHPIQEAGRLRQSVLAAVDRAETAAAIRAVILDEGDASATSIATLLHERATERVARLML